MSRMTVVCGSALNSCQVQLLIGFGPAFSVKVHFSRLMRGVGPAERTGKSSTRCCPGGMRLAVPAGGFRPVNPRVAMIVFPMIALHDPKLGAPPRQLYERKAP